MGGGISPDLGGMLGIPAPNWTKGSAGVPRDSRVPTHHPHPTRGTGRVAEPGSSHERALSALAPPPGNPPSPGGLWGAGIGAPHAGQNLQWGSRGMGGRWGGEMKWHEMKGFGGLVWGFLWFFFFKCYSQPKRPNGSLDGKISSHTDRS